MNHWQDVASAMVDAREDVDMSGVRYVDSPLCMISILSYKQVVYHGSSNLTNLECAASHSVRMQVKRD